MSTPRIACVACLTLAAALNAAPVATFEYTNVANFDDYTIFNEDVASNQSVGSILLTGVLTQLTPQSPAWDATVSVVAPDGQFLVIRPFPLTNDFSTLELSSVRSVIQTVVGNAQGPWIIALREDFGDLSPDVADSQWNSLQIQLDTVGIGEPPPCPNGLGSVTLTNVVSNGTSASPGATRTIDFGIPGTINSIAISGLVTADNFSRLSDARLRLTAPSGEAYEFGDTGLPIASGTGVIDLRELQLSQPEAGTGPWIVDFYELLDEPSIADATWASLCVAASRVDEDLTVIGIAEDPFIRESLDPLLLRAYVTPLFNSPSTFNSSGSVTVDATSLGAGVITLRDDGVAPDDVADDRTFSSTLSPALRGNLWELLPLNATDDQGRSATSSISVAFVGDPLACVSGLATLNLDSAVASGSAGDEANTTYVIPMSIDDTISRITLAGRYLASEGVDRRDAALRITAPSGNQYTLENLSDDIGAGLAEIYGLEFDLSEPEESQGNWEVEFYTSGGLTVGLPPIQWESACVSLDSEGACCTGSGCTVTTASACQGSGGTFQGPGTNCGTPTYTNDSSSLSFEEIRALGDLLNISNADDATQPVQIGFDFNFMGNVYSSVNVSTNGNIQFGNNPSALNVNFPIPTAAAPNNMIAPLWNDFNPAAGGGIYTLSDTSGGAGNGRFIVSWEDVPRYLFNDSNSFQVILHESGSFEFRYGPISPEGVPGDFTVGYESINGTSGVSIPGGSIGAGNTARSFSFIPGPSPCAGGACAACPADYDQDGGVTGGDVAAFIPDFEQGDTCADVDGDGGVTGGDLATFFQFFEAGGC